MTSTVFFQNQIGWEWKKLQTYFRGDAKKARQIFLEFKERAEKAGYYLSSRQYLNASTGVEWRYEHRGHKSGKLMATYIILCTDVDLEKNMAQFKKEGRI